MRIVCLHPEATPQSKRIHANVIALKNGCPQTRLCRAAEEQFVAPQAHPSNIPVDPEPAPLGPSSTHLHAISRDLQVIVPDIIQS